MTGGPPETFLEIGAIPVLSFSTIPMIAATIRFNLENSIMWRIWTDQGIEKVYGKKIHQTRADYYTRENTKIYFNSLAYIPIIFTAVGMGVLAPMRSDKPKLFFVLCLFISALCLIQCVLVHQGRMSLLQQIEKEINNGDIFTEREVVDTVVETDDSQKKGFFGGISDSIESSIPELPDPLLDVPIGGGSDDTQTKQGGGRIEGFVDIGGDPPKKTLDDIKSWYKSIKIKHDPYDEWTGNCSDSKCADIDKLISEYEAEIEKKNESISEDNSKITSDDEPRIPLHTIDEKRLKKLQDKIIFKYSLVSAFKKMPSITASDDDVRTWLKEFFIINRENPSSHSDYKKLSNDDLKEIQTLIDSGQSDRLVNSDVKEIRGSEKNAITERDRLKIRYGWTATES